VGTATLSEIERQRADRRGEVDIGHLTKADTIRPVEDEYEIPRRPSAGEDVKPCRERDDQSRGCRDGN
jgi:hypothetical protein